MSTVGEVRGLVVAQESGSRGDHLISYYTYLLVHISILRSRRHPFSHLILNLPLHLADSTLLPYINSS